MAHNKTLSQFKYSASLIFIIAFFLVPGLSFAAPYVPPVPAPPQLPTVPSPLPPTLPATPLPPTPQLPTAPTPPPSVPSVPLPTPPTLPNPPDLPTIPTLPTNPTTPDLPTPPTLPTPPPLPPGISTPTPPTPLAEAYLSIWTDGYVTPITSGTRNIGYTDQVTKLSWSSTNATLCEGSNFSTSGLVSGDIYDGDSSLVMASGDTVTYGIRCNNSVNVWSSWRYVTIVKDDTPPVVANSAPDSPIIKGVDMSTSAPIGVTINDLATFTFKASDPDGDRIVYLVDWDFDGVSDQRVPGSDYVNSGSAESADFSWSTLGGQTFQVLAMDENGNKSGWTVHSLVVTDVSVAPPALPQITLSVVKNLVRSGEKTEAEVRIIADYPMACKIFGVEGDLVSFNHNGSSSEVSYTYDTKILFAAQVVTLECIPNVTGTTLQTEVRQTRVDVVPTVQEI